MSPFSEFDIVSRHEDGTFQLFGRNGVVAHTRADTVVEAGVELAVGARVLAETEARGSRTIAARIRATRQVDPVDRVRALVDAYRTAGFDPGIRDPRDVLSRATDGDLELVLWRKFARHGPVFPRCRWVDAETQVADAQALLSDAGADLALDPSSLQGFELDEMISRIVGAANAALARAGSEKRLFEITGCPDPDPVERSILCTPRQLGVFVGRGVVTAPAAHVERASLPVSHVSLGRRFSAKLIDAVACGLAVGGFGAMTHPIAGLAIGYGWFLVSDASGSFGKSLLRLRVVDHETGRACSVRQSVLRNLPLIITLLPRQLHRLLLGVDHDAYSGAFPALVLFLSGVGIAIQLAEWHKARRDREGRRYGDLWAGTMVAPSRVG